MRVELRFGPVARLWAEVERTRFGDAAVVWMEVGEEGTGVRLGIEALDRLLAEAAYEGQSAGVRVCGVSTERAATPAIVGLSEEVQGWVVLKIATIEVEGRLWEGTCAKGDLKRVLQEGRELLVRPETEAR